MLRKFVEVLARGRIIRRSLFVRGNRVNLYVSPDAQLKYLRLGSNAFDADLVQIAESFVSHDSCIWDVGANVGVFAFSAAACAPSGTIVAIEADIWLAQILRQSCHLESQRGRDIRVVPVAVSNHDGVATFRIAARGRASNALASSSGSTQMGGIREEQHVPTLTLDTLAQNLPLPSFVKIDVEGAEYLVLQGASKLITQTRPVFYIEVGGGTFSKVKSVFDDAGFVCFDSKGRCWSNELQESNYFFVPQENSEAFAALARLRLRYGG